MVPIATESRQWEETYVHSDTYPQGTTWTGKIGTNTPTRRHGLTKRIPIHFRLDKLHSRSQCQTSNWSPTSSNSRDFCTASLWHCNQNRVRSAKFTPLDNKPTYSRNLPVPINANDDILVELARPQKKSFIEKIPMGKYARPIFGRRKPNGKLRLLVQLWKVKTDIADAYIINNHLVSSLSDAAQHMAGKNLFCKLDSCRRFPAFKWLTNNQPNSLHSTSRVEHSHTEDWHEDSVIPNQQFWAGFSKISIQSSKPTNGNITLMKLA